MTYAPRYYTRDGFPIDDPREWARQFEHADRRVAFSKVADAADPNRSFDVSTVFLGLDHNHSGIGLPLIFETMVWGSGSDVDELCQRYSTEQDATNGHYAAVSLVASDMVDPVVMNADRPTTP